MPFLFYDIHPTKQIQYKSWKREKVISINKYYVECIDGCSGFKYLNMVNLSNVIKLLENINFIKLRTSSVDVASIFDTDNINQHLSEAEALHAAKHSIFSFDTLHFLHMINNLGRRNI